MELLAIWKRGFYRECFALRWELRELVWGFYRQVGVLGGVWSGSDGAGDTRQQVRQGEGGPVAGDDGGGCAAKGGVGGGSALQRGRGAVVVRMEVGTRARGTSEWWGQ
jgi:hypothetical protein